MPGVSSPLASKLQIKPGHHVLVLRAPAGFAGQLVPLPEGVRLAHSAKGKHDVVHLFVQDTADFAKHRSAAVSSLKPGGVLWISWPKLSAKRQTDLNRDILVREARAAALRPVAAVSIDETWSALRFKSDA